MTIEHKGRLAFYVSLSAFSLMLTASHIFPLIWDVETYEGYKPFIFWYVFIEHAVVLALAKVAQMFMSNKWHRLISDLFIAGLYADLIDRLVGITDFHVRDLYIFGFVISALGFKHLRKEWQARKK